MMHDAGARQCHWAAVDWGKAEHTVAVADPRHRVVDLFAVPSTLEGFEQLEQRLRVYEVGGIAIESTRNPLIGFLADRGYTIFSINPKLSKQWREGSSVAGVKSDKRDACVLAVELSRRHEELRSSKTPCSDDVLSGLTEALRELINERTALVQRLRAKLETYYPAMLQFINDLTAPLAWALVKRFPTPATLAEARKDTLLRFLRAHRVGLKPVWLERIEQRKKATDWPASPTAQADEAMALACVAQLQALQAHIDKLDQLIEERLPQVKNHDLMLSLPGAGKRLAPELAAIFLKLETEGAQNEAVRNLSGVAPVERASGQRRQTCMRRRCNKHWRNTLHLFAASSHRYSKWAGAYYSMCKERGDKYGTILRKLADKWLRIILVMIRKGLEYDEQVYIQSLRRTGSPVYARLCGQAGG